MYNIWPLKFYKNWHMFLYFFQKSKVTLPPGPERLNAQRNETCHVSVHLLSLKCYNCSSATEYSRIGHFHFLPWIKYSNIVMCYVILFLLLQIFHTCHIWTFLIDVTLTFIICYVHFVSVPVNLMSSLFIKLSLTCMESLSKKSFKVWCIS